LVKRVKYLCVNPKSIYKGKKGREEEGRKGKGGKGRKGKELKKWSDINS
jgi:hypothetical protein